MFYNYIKLIWSYIWAKIKGFSVREWILTILVLSLGIICIQQHFANKTKIVTVSEQMNEYKNKADQEYLAKTILLQDVNQLKKTNDSLYQEYKKIKDEKPLVVTKTITKTVYDSIEVPTVIEKTNVGYTLNWNYKEQYDNYNYFDIVGHSRIDSLVTESKTVLEKVEIGSDLYLDIVDGGSSNSVRVIARSNNPHVAFTSIEGAVFDPTQNSLIKNCFPKKRWGLGVSAGVGVGYDVNNKSFSVGPQISFGITYNILTW